MLYLAMAICLVWPAAISRATNLRMPHQTTTSKHTQWEPQGNCCCNTTPTEGWVVVPELVAWEVVCLSNPKKHKKHQKKDVRLQANIAKKKPVKMPLNVDEDEAYRLWCKGHAFPVAEAAKEHNLEMLRILSKKEHKVQTPPKHLHPLHYAARKGHIQVVHALIKHFAVDPARTDHNGLNALFYAVIHDQTRMISVLHKQYGLDLKLQDRKGSSLQHYAAAYAHEKTLNLLVLNYKLDPDLPTKLGWRPVHYAAQHGRIKAVKWFLEGGHANLYAKTHKGKTPFDLAQEKGRSKVSKYLAQQMKQKS